MKDISPGYSLLFQRSSKTIKRVCALLVGISFVLWWLLPGKLFYAPTSYVIEDADGNLLSASIATDGQWRFPNNENVPQKFIDCITVFEDKRFYDHSGIDLASVARALVVNVNTGHFAEGGSTITMQVSRISAKHNSRSIWNKIKESVQALRIESAYSKKEIMGLYASNAPFGSNVVGLDAAAWRYFGRSPEKLSWAEMATLAVLPNAPSLVHPGKNRSLLLTKRDHLLHQLVEAGIILPATAELAMLETLPLQPLPLPRLAPHLLDRFKKENNPGAYTKISSTLDKSLQQNIIRILEQHHQVLKGNGINNICAVVLDVETSNCLAYVGNIDEPLNKEYESNVDIINAHRSPGSALKPILYAAMLSDGSILPGSLVADIPTEIGGYNPQNFDLGYDGAVPASRALSRSLNIPAVRLLQQFKYQRFYETLQQCGISTLKNPADYYGLSMILGGCEITMWELAGVYASFARVVNHQDQNKGVMNPDDFHSPVYYHSMPEKKKNANVTLDPTSIYFTFQAMQEVMRPGEEGLWQQFTSSQKIAWKTGTSFGFRDGWAIGVTAKNVVAVWVGNADGEGRSGLIGINTAAPVMFDIFRLLPTVTWFIQPKYNYSYIPVCRATGFRANIDCADVDTLLMPPNAEKSPLCPYHKIIHLDPTGTYQVTEKCAGTMDMIHKSWFILPPAMEYYYKQHNHDYQAVPIFQPGCIAENSLRQMELIYPQPNAKIYIPLEMNGQKGQVIFTAAHRNRKSKIFWSLDNTYLGTSLTVHQFAMSPPAGKHIITLTDEDGNTISRSFEVIEK